MLAGTSGGTEPTGSRSVRAPAFELCVGQWGTEQEESSAVGVIGHRSSHEAVGMLGGAVLPPGMAIPEPGVSEAFASGPDATTEEQRTVQRGVIRQRWDRPRGGRQHRRAVGPPDLRGIGPGVVGPGANPDHQLPAAVGHDHKGGEHQPQEDLPPSTLSRDSLEHFSSGCSVRRPPVSVQSQRAINQRGLCSKRYRTGVRYSRPGPVRSAAPHLLCKDLL